MSDLPDRPLLFASGSEAGRINPLLTIAAAFVGGGNTNIVFATTDDRAEEIGDLGAGVRFASLGEPNTEHLPRNWDEETFAIFTGPSRSRAVASYLDRVIDAAYMRRMYDRALAVIDEVRPSLIVVDQDAPYVMDAAMRRGIPYVMCVPIPVSAVYTERTPADFPKAFSGLPRVMSPEQVAENQQFEKEIGEMLMASGRIAEFFKARVADGFANAGSVSSLYGDGAKEVLGFSVFGIEYEFPEVPPNVRMVGAVVRDEVVRDEERGGPTGLTAWLDEFESIVYIGFGTIMRPSAGQVSAIVAAARELGPQVGVLWRLPESHQALLEPLGELPGNLRVESWLPSQTEVLAHPNVKVFFNHGGGNAVNEGSWFGKPQLVMPFWMDCYDWAVRAVDAGFGLTLPYHTDPDPALLARLLRTLLDNDSFGARARYWSDRQRAAGGVAAAVSIIREHAAEAVSS